MRIEKELQFFTATNNKKPLKEWLSKINEPIQSRIQRRLDRLSLGHYGDVKSVGEGIFELRLQFGPGYRIYFAETDGYIILLLYGGDKSTQAKDIKKAKQYWREFLERVSI